MTEPKKSTRKVQTTFGGQTPRKCKQCHMSYYPHLKRDAAAHKKHHASYLDGPSWPVSSDYLPIKTISLRKNGKSVPVRYVSVPKSAHLSALMLVVNGELNALTEADHMDVQTTGIAAKSYVAIAGGRAVGVCTVEPIRDVALQGRWMVIESQEIVAEKPNNKVRVGISRIWVAPGWRREGIAHSLLDVVRESTIYGAVLDKSALGFSQPSSAGARLAKSYNGLSHKGNWLIPVYLEMEQS